MYLPILSLVLGLAVAVSGKDKKIQKGERTQDLGIQRGERSQKSFGLHTSLDGNALLWANTSAVTTAGFFGNAAILLAGVYILTHTEEVGALADSLLPVGRAKVQTGQWEGLEEEEENMFQKGQHLIGDTFNKFTDNLNNVNEDLSKRKGGLFQLPSLEKLMPTSLENPLTKLKEKLFPSESEDKVLTLVQKPPMKLQPAEHLFTDNFAEKLAMQSWNYLQDKENTEEDSWSFNINKNAEFDNYEDKSLPFLFDSESSYPSYQQHASTSKDNIVIETLVPEMREALQPPAKEEFPQENKKSLSEEKEKLAEHKAKLQEKKRKWAENFLQNFYKKQELEEETEKQMQLAVSPHGEDSLEYDQEHLVGTYDQYEADGFYDPNGFYEDGFRIGDDEVQAIIAAQLSDFESFGVKIPKTSEELEKEDGENNDKYPEIQRNIEESETTTFSPEETTLLNEEETTFPAQNTEEITISDEEENMDDKENKSDLVSSIGNDVNISEDMVEEQTKKMKNISDDIVEEPTKKMKKVKKLKKKTKE